MVLMDFLMLFTLINAPRNFYNLMNDESSDYIDSFVVVYLDNIVLKVIARFNNTNPMLNHQ